jgi:hypothetical protein
MHVVLRFSPMILYIPVLRPTFIPFPGIAGGAG